MSPEPETDAMSEAVEVMARAAYRNPQPGERVRIEKALRALLSPSVTTCETCGGTGGEAMFHVNADSIQESTWVSCPAEDCDDGQVTRPSIAVLRGELEQDAWRGLTDGTLRDRRLNRDDVPLYRDASEEGK